MKRIELDERSELRDDRRIEPHGLAEAQSALNDAMPHRVNLPRRSRAAHAVVENARDLPL